MRLVNWRSLAIGAAGLSLAACGDDVSVVTPQPILSVAPNAVTCQAGTQTSIGASLTPTQSGATFTFASASASPAGAFTVTGTGATATINCVTAGTGSITVTSGTQTITVPVTVTTNPNAGGITGIIVAPTTSTVGIGGTTTITATVIGTGSNLQARFRSAQPTIATVDSLSGVVTGRAQGTATIIAEAAANRTFAAAATVQVLAASQLIQGITAVPNPVSLQAGQTQQLAATVTLQANAPTNTPRTVTYSSQNTAIATVSSTGLVTAVANGSTSIIVRSTADTSFTTVVPVTVREAAPIRLSIANLSNAAGVLIDPNNPVGTAAAGANAVGTIFANLNFDPGDARVTAVEVSLSNDTTFRVVCRQTFSAALADAYRQALTTGAADVQPISCPINLTEIDSLGRAGVLNGTATLRARVIGRLPGQTSDQAQQVAQFTLQTLQLNNQSGFVFALSNTLDSAQAALSGLPVQNGQATNPLNGQAYRAGSLTFRLLPVNFTNNAGVQPLPDSVVVTLTDAGNALTGTPGFTRTGTVSRNSAGQTVVTFPGRSALGGSTALGSRSLVTNNPQPIDGLTSNPATGTLVSISGAGVNVGTVPNVLLQPNGQLFGNNTVFFDNQAPQPVLSFNVPTSNFTPITAGGTQAGFINGGFTFNRGTAANFQPTYQAVAGGAGTTTNNPDFGGVDRVRAQFFAALVSNLTTGSAANVVSTAATPVDSGAQLAAANSSLAYSSAVRLIDALGNQRSQLVQGAGIALDVTGQSVTTGGAAVTFGVDLSAPTLAIANLSTINGVVVNAANQGTAANTISVGYSDDIGFDSTAVIQILGTQMRRAGDSPTAAVSTYCLTGVDAANNAVFSGASTATTGACTFVSVAGRNAIILSNTATGQYDLRMRTRDQAGNISSEVNVTRYVDVVAPTVGGVSLPQTLTGNAPASFTTAASDNLELGSAFPQISYAAAPAAYGAGLFQIAYTQSQTLLGSPFGTITASVNNSIALTVPSFIRSVTFTAGNVPQVPSAANLAQVVVSVIADAAGNQGVTQVPIPTANISQTGFSGTIFDTGVQTSDINAFALTFSNNAAAFPNQLSLGATTNAPTTGTFSVATSGQVNAFLNPFVRVELYYSQVGGPAIYQFLGTAPVGIVTDDQTAGAIGRTITSSYVFTPVGTALARGVTATTSVQYNVIAVGITAAGDALVSAPVTVTVIQ